jgi:hypothetical protein
MNTKIDPFSKSNRQLVEFAKTNLAGTVQVVVDAASHAYDPTTISAIRAHGWTH